MRTPCSCEISGGQHCSTLGPPTPTHSCAGDRLGAPTAVPEEVLPDAVLHPPAVPADTAFTESALREKRVIVAAIVDLWLCVCLRRARRVARVSGVLGLPGLAW